MYKKSIPTDESPVIGLEIDGNLSLKGWENSEILVKCESEEDLTIETQEEQVRISCQRDCMIRVPYGAQMNVARLEGNANIKLVEGALSIQDVRGNLNLRSVGPVEVDQVQGNLAAKNVAGDLRAGAVRGNLTAKDIEGDLLVNGPVEGNLKIDDLEGGAQASAQGNITMRLDPRPGKSYEFDAQGSLVCRIPADASAEVEISDASNFHINLPDANLPKDRGTPFTFTLGEGDASLKLSAGGNLILSNLTISFGMEDFDFDLGEDFGGSVEAISEQVNQQIQAQMEMVEQQLNTQLSNLSSLVESMQLSPEQADRISQRAREVSERVNARTQEKIRRAQEKLNRKLEAARRRAEMKARAAERAARDRRRKTDSFSQTFGRSTVQTPPPPPSEPVSEEEHLLILKMLEQGKISIEEAEKLLQALEGKR